MLRPRHATLDGALEAIIHLLRGLTQAGLLARSGGHRPHESVANKFVDMVTALVPEEIWG